jgi:Peptidase family S41
VLGAAAGAVALVQVGSGGAAPAQQTPGVAGDVRTLATEMERLHPDLFHSTPRDVFRAAVDRLVARVPDLSRDEAVVEVMRLAALAGERDGHTGVYPFDPAHRPGLHGYPIRVYRFADGTFVVAERGPDGLVGARLVAIEGVQLDDVVELVRPLVHRDNEMTVEARLPEWLVTAEILHGVGVTDTAERATFTFRLPDGARRDVTLEPIPAADHLRTLGSWRVPPLSAKRPLFARYLDRPWAVTTIANGTIAYMAYNQVNRGVSEAADRLLALARRTKIRRVVVDVRFNGGGDNTTFYPLLGALSQRAIDRPGRLVLLVGRVTFSAAGNFVSDVERQTRARLVGEPTGGSPSQWGDATSVVLPSLGLTVHVATTYHEFGPRGDTRTTIEPDVAVPVTSADFLAGRDPVLAGAVRLP